MHSTLDNRQSASLTIYIINTNIQMTLQSCHTRVQGACVRIRHSSKHQTKAALDQILLIASITYYPLPSMDGSWYR